MNEEIKTKKREELDCSQQVKDVVDSLLVIDWKKRPTIEEIFRIPIIRRELDQIFKDFRGL
jgi:hypothetical protein